ncbi:hypothetical protein UCREL1_7558 [Eutypa lata UCREL1]|uniref:Uncharacterized protein n=1 Tax=Eutypa lata (strain UCR-EL1) TaxID=1287681 RepID=M7TFF6_EUTLA|nr:hypothetical protein UCREL1_7558 [Eutypa lata UCREL1]
MSDQNNHPPDKPMSDKNKKPTGKTRSDDDAYVLDAMMNDLGSNRLEDLATEDGGGPFRQRGPRPPPTQIRRDLEPMSDEAAAASRRYREAISNIDDWDSRGVRDLDSIADGNLHRRNQVVVSGSSHAFPAKGTFNGDFNFIKPKKGTQNNPQYNPS